MVKREKKAPVPKKTTKEKAPKDVKMKKSGTGGSACGSC